MKSHFLLLCSSAILALTSACKKTATDDLCTPSLNIEVLDSQLRTNLNVGLKGYTYIMKDGQVKITNSAGYARTPQDGLQHWDEFQKMHVASISKTISTVAALRLLKMKGLSVEEKIYKFLPSDWQLGNGVEYLTFSDLMSHRTGWMDVIYESDDLSADFDGLKKMVANGTTGTKWRKYSNVNHALLRVILPKLADYPNNSGVVYDAQTTARRYETIVKHLVFEPLGIEAALFDNDPNAGVLAYSSGSDLKGELETFDYRMTAGGDGWVFSAYDLAKFWAYLWHSNVLIDDSQRATMKDKELGLFDSDYTSNQQKYYCKRGDWLRIVNEEKHWLRSIAVEFPDGTAVVLFVNSPHSKSLKDIIVDSYEKSIGCF